MTGVSKRFGGAAALRGVDFDLSAGEVVALVGENGAGKSTLMKILAGIHAPDDGTVELDGRAVRIGSPGESARLGIAIVHQELELIDTLDIAGNVFLGREPTWAGPVRLLDRGRLRSEALGWLARVGLDLDPATRVAALSTAERQLVEIAKALSLDARVLILDEPTSSLTDVETARLFRLIAGLRSRGVGLVYISHRLAEIAEIADRSVVLRDGKNAGHLGSGEFDRARLVRMMVGDVESATTRPDRTVESGETAFEIRKMRTSRFPDWEVSVSVRRGEIFGLAGLVGSGRTELARAVMGLDSTATGEVRVEGELVAIRSPRDALAFGIALVPEDRRSHGLVMGLSVRSNVTLPFIARLARAGWIDRGRERAAVAEVVDRVGIRAASMAAGVETLSGGNQQKTVLARWLAFGPRVLILDEPTRGVDVGSRAEIYRILADLREAGVPILVISSDLEEILELSDRVGVMHEGRLRGVLERDQCTRQSIMSLAVA
jgi:ribose transport system ATP-binding protein